MTSTDATIVCNGAESIQEQAATVYHESIILGSAGLWQSLTAEDAVLRSHFFLKVSLNSC